jgi:hypothetical protein
MEQTRTINLDGESYEVDQFSQGVQQAIAIYNKFSVQLQDAQLEVMKIQAAIQQVGNQITEAVKAELAAKEAETPVDAPAPSEEPATTH